MNPRYKDGVIVLGLVLPILAVIGVLVLLLTQKKRIEKEYDARALTHQQNQRVRLETSGISAQIEAYSDRKEKWDGVLLNSDVGAVTGILREISTTFAGSETFKQDNFSFMNRKSGIGSASEQTSASFDLALSGTFQALQQSLLSLESRMPNLSLNSIVLEPQRNGQLLEAKLSYSAWTK